MNWLYKSVRVNVVVLVVVVVATGALGTYLVQKSSAAGPYYCTYHTYGWVYDREGYCISQIKNDYNALRYAGSNIGTYNYLVYDNPSSKLWDSTAAANTRAFQRDKGIGVDGQVGPQTWGYICSALKNYDFSGPYGWYVQPAYYNSGCGN